MEQKTMKRINSHKTMAMETLENHPESRNNDLVLLLKTWESKGMHLTETQKYTIMNCGVEIKTLIRQRQRLQSEGQYLPTDPEVAKKRRKMAAEFAEHYSEL